jgi:hypothetical protein
MATDPDKDVSVAVTAEATGVILRPDPGGYYDAGGKWIRDVVADLPIQATVQPASSKALMDLPEGVRPEAKYMLWTAHQPVAIDDLVLYDGDTFRVVHVWDRLRDGGFTRAALGQVREQPGAGRISHGSWSNGGVEKR